MVRRVAGKTGSYNRHGLGLVCQTARTPIGFIESGTAAVR